jgi:hypothetical protein
MVHANNKFPVSQSRSPFRKVLPAVQMRAIDFYYLLYFKSFDNNKKKQRCKYQECPRPPSEIKN